MQLFELILVLLFCVMASAIFDQIISRVSLPLLQIGVGLIAALLFPFLAEAHVDSELFMMLFIAPLLFREAKETNRTTLWSNRWSVLSLAIALVIASVLAAGFILHWIIPSISLAAAFACAAALGPTDAAAVAALGSTIHLTKRQSSLLSGESLINDASGVVSFQFAIAAAVTGAFSAVEATLSFGVLFFGGILIGLLTGWLFSTGMRILRRRGFVNTTIHVMYEVLSPFVIFLAAEELHVSGILAVVAAGLIMQEHSLHLMSSETARHHLVANSFWEVIVFLINGIIFVMLGMQLPKVMQPQDMEGIHPGLVLTATLAVTATIILMRFLWISCMELRHKDPETGLRGTAHAALTLKQALVTTIAGPKGAVTLSIIMTIPLTVSSGRVFPFRDLIIFLTSGVILCTLLLADFVLPKLAPKEVDADEEKQLQQARLLVLEGVVDELRRALDENTGEEFVPAGRLALMRYRTRLMHQRFTMEEHGDTLKQVMRGVLDAQQKRADEIQSDAYDVSARERMPYYSILPGIRASVGYIGDALKVGARFETRRGRLFFRLFRHRQKDFEEEKMARVYYDTCLFAIDLEHAAMDYLHEVEKENDPDRVRAAQLLLKEHEASLQSLWGRINFGQETPQEDTGVYDHGFHESMPEGVSANTASQFRMAQMYAEEVDAYALSMELDQIQKLRAKGTISESVSRELREQVYLMQTAFI